MFHGLSNNYQLRIGAIYTSAACSVCTFFISQVILYLLSSNYSSVFLKLLINIGIFIFGYWIVFFTFRKKINYCLIKFGLIKQAPQAYSLTGKIIFITISEIFWVISLSLANYYLLTWGLSANSAAAISQLLINLTIWLPLLPLWEYLATVHLANGFDRIFNKIRRNDV